MKKKLSTILTVLMIAMLTISTADAGQGIKITSNPTFSLGSLIVDGSLQGTGQTIVTVVLDATGTCKTKEVSATGFQVLSGNEESETENNNRQFHVETNDPEGCNNDPGPNNSFVFWTKATISVYSGDMTCQFQYCGGIGLTSSITAVDNALLVQQEYKCKTKQDAHTVHCTPLNKGGSNNGNGGVGICHATGNKKNPYVLLTVNANGLNGHSKHTGDIIPAPADGCPN